MLKFGGGAPLLELLSGNVDALVAINLVDILKLADDPRFRVYYALSPRRIQIHWNHRNGLFHDPAVRRALTLAINRRELHRVLNFPADLPLTDGIYTIRQFRQRRFDKPLPYDPQTAEQLLRNAGWRRRSANGLRERNGREFRFTAIVPTMPGGTLLTAAILVQDQLRRVGIRMEIQALENLLVRRRLRAGEFEAGVHWTGSGPGAHALFLGEDSATGYANSRVTELLNAAMDAVDLAELDGIYRELSKIVRSDMPVTFLFPEVKTSVVHRRIKGLSSPFRANPVFHMEHLWLEDED